MTRSPFSPRAPRCPTGDVRRIGSLALLLALLTPAAGLRAQPTAVTGRIHESAPTQETPVIGARIAIAGGSADQSTTSDSEGRFTLHVRPTAGQVLEISKDGHETAQVTLDDVTRANAVDVALKPTPGDISLTRSGDNDCVDLPPPPEGVPGLREYARIAVHNDGILRVNAAKLPFYNNPGYVYRQTDKGWEPNELDYILIRSPLPLLGGFVYVITFGGDKDLCGPWSIDATHPN